MEKLGVDVDTEAAKTASSKDDPRCPTCQRALVRDASPPQCPVCGTEPFEPKSPRSA